VPNVAKTKYACEILGITFPTAKALRFHCQVILDRYLTPCSQPEEVLSDDDAEFFVELVRLRDGTRIPQGTYVNRVVRCCRDGQIGRHVRFEYGDGSRDMIGWSKLCGGPQATATQVTNAMRESIRDQMQAVYSAFFRGRNSGPCPQTGIELSVTGEFHGGRAVVHHDGMPFAAIRDLWLSTAGVRLEDLTLKDLFDGGGYELAEGELRDSWRAFHADRANLVVVSERWHREHHSASAKEDAA
jgi:hypothetical protein